MESYEQRLNRELLELDEKVPAISIILNGVNSVYRMNNNEFDNPFERKRMLYQAVECGLSIYATNNKQIASELLDANERINTLEEQVDRLSSLLLNN